MRFRDIFLISFVGLISYAFWSLGGTDITPNLSRAKKINREDARRQGTYLLKKKDWVEFQVSRNDMNLRLLTNAAVGDPNSPSTSQNDPRQGWRYSIECELIDEQNQVLESQHYHFRSKVQPLLDNETGKEIYPLFFGKSSLIATQTRAMQVPVQVHEQRVATIRIRLHAQDEEIKEVVARVHARVEREDYDEKQTWNRISQERRERICRYCVYDHELLTDEEKAQLLRWKWHVAPTLGEFEKRILYSVGDFDDLPVDSTLLPAGLYATPGLLATIPVPDEPGTLKLKIQCDESNPDSMINIEYFGQNIFVRKSSQEALKPKNEILLVAKGGLVQLEPTQPCIIRAFWIHDDTVSEIQALQEIDITPSPMKLQTYLVDKRKIEFPISHLQNQDTPLRLSIREIRDSSFFDNEEVNANGPIHWEMHDANGDVVKAGKLSMESPISTYDYFSLDKQYYLLSDPLTVHFAVPANVKTFHLRSDSQPVFVNASVRPKGLKSRTRVPEDYVDFHRLERNSRTWFQIKPVNQKQIVEENRAFIANLQARPPETDPAILAGDYEWNRFLPDGKWIGREMLIPHDTITPLREEAMSSVYYQINSNQAEFENHQLARQEKTILFDSPSRPGRIRIRVNSKLVYDKKVIAKQGQIRLAASLFENSGTVAIESDNPTQFFAGGLTFPAKQPFIKRTATRLDNGQLVFRYNKRTDDQELLILKFFQTQSEQQRYRYLVKIKPISAIGDQPVSNDWTNRHREFDIKATEISPSIVLGDQRRADTGYQCFVPLNRDLPSGEYEIHVEQQGPTSTNYVLCYQTVVNNAQPLAEPTKSPVRPIATIEKTKSSAPTAERANSNKQSLDIKNIEIAEAQTSKNGIPEGISPKHDPSEHEVKFDEFDEPKMLDVKEPRDAQAQRHPTIQHSILEITKGDELQTPTVYQFLKPILDRSKGDTNAAFPDSLELRKVQELFEQTLHEALTPQLIDEWNQHGWEVTSSKELDVIVISEIQNKKAGRGIYAIRPNSDSKLVVQAPHRYFDSQTGIIAAKLFAEHDIKAIAWNTIHRQQVDLAHQNRHEFNSFMSALANSDSQISFVQIHGFESQNKTGEANRADIIVSDTFQYPGLVVKEITRQLKTSFGSDLVKLYPNEVRQLGGTKNSQSAILKSQSQFRRFFHLELDSDFRKTISNSASKRAEFVRCINEVIRKSDN